ncbi:hypothetical protein LCGC14_1065820 [marine sediment metagenome]|uniref:Uncharacterized protein n=1 Tax=marine sediment metagenome TaxID=412755 RepID=A0A0F9MJQ9_9ZZZZ
MRTLLVIALLFVAGCIPTAQQVQTLTNDVDELMVVVDKVQERIVTTNEAVKKKADESALDQLVAANEASRPFNPYADEVNAVLGLVAIVGGIWAKGKIDENKKLGAKYQAHKQGAEKFRVRNPEKDSELYSDIEAARIRNKVT